MVTMTDHRAGSRPGGLLATALICILLAGCSSAGAGSPAETESTSRAKTQEASDGSIPDPRDIRGPSTAETVTEVVPVEDHAKPKLPVMVVDQSGNRVKVESARRLLALDSYGTLAEIVVGLGLGDCLVGRGNSNTLTSMSKLPVVTQNGHELNTEAILRLRPSLILTDTTIGPPDAMDRLRASGITVVTFSPDRALSTVGTQIRAVSHALGVDTGGDVLASRVESEIGAARKRIAGLTPDKPLRMVFLYLRGQAGVFFIFGKGMGSDDLIASIGGRDVAAEAGVTGTKPASGEALAAADPEVILVMTDGLESAGGVEALLDRPGIAQTAAGAHRRVVDMADGQILSFGPTTGAVLTSLADAVYRP
jgi:iron complex transport system substrate-binding protein